MSAGKKHNPVPACTGYGTGTAATSNGRNSAGGNAAAGEQRFPWLEAAATPRRAFVVDAL